LAVEIEVAASQRSKAGMVVDNVVSSWGCSAVYDGSVRGNSPIEINTAPAKGDVFLQQIQELTDALKLQSATVNNTCGLHVHVDATDFTYYDLRRLILLYNKLEPALFRILPPSRRGNRFCSPVNQAWVEALSSAKDVRHTVRRAIYGSVAQAYALQKKK